MADKASATIRGHRAVLLHRWRLRASAYSDPVSTPPRKPPAPKTLSRCPGGTTSGELPADADRTGHSTSKARAAKYRSTTEAAAAPATAPAAAPRPRSQTAPRPKPVRKTVDVAPDLYRQFDAWSVRELLANSDVAESVRNRISASTDCTDRRY